MVLPNQTFKNFEHIYRDVAGYDMSYDEFKEFYRKSWAEDYKNLCIDRSKKRFQGRYCICNESKKNVSRSHITDEGFLITWMLYSIKGREELENLHN